MITRMLLAAICLASILAVSPIATAQSQVPDPWRGFQYSTAWIWITRVDRSHQHLMSPDRSMPIIPKDRKALLPMPGDIIQMRMPNELILVGFRRSGEELRSTPPPPRPSDDDRTGLQLAEGAQLVVSEIAFAREQEEMNGDVVWARVSPASSAPFEIKAALARLPRTREIYPTREVPIPAQLRLSDEVVSVEKWAIVDYVYYGDETPAQEIAWQVQQSDGIAVIEVSDITSHLIEEGTWLRTEVAAQTITIVKNRELFASPFTALFDGGAMMIKDVEVRAGDYPTLKRGGRYLVFITANGSAHWMGYVFDVTDARQVKRPQFAKTPDNQSPNPFKGMSLSEAIREMNKSVKEKEVIK